MNTENFQESRFNPEEWMNRLFEFMNAVQYFAIDLIQAFKTYCKKVCYKSGKKFDPQSPNSPP